jgi:alginate O-acetyltransferase complex protein AlgI
VRQQNVLLVAASYLFYGWWDWRFLSLIIVSTILDYCVARAVGSAKGAGRKRLLLTISVVGNLGILGFFKYCDFFIQSAVGVLGAFGLAADVDVLGIILPVGISFYTFQTMSYTIDVYRGRMEPVRDVLAVAAYVSFFPQLVAGPIERGSRLLPQMQAPRRLTAAGAEEGFWLVVFGFFKKCVVADNLAILVERAYSASDSSSMIVIGTIAFAVQIYCDFSGYSDIARGVSRWFGIDLMVNFRAPYFARSIQEFWRRWHISLSTWLRDYLYVPLGGNRKGPKRTYVNLMLTMLLGGLWHGAAWNFVAWGAWHGGLLAVHRFFFSRNPEARTGLVWSVAGWTVTFVAVLVSWLLFRARSLSHALRLLETVFRGGEESLFGLGELVALVALALPVVLIDLWQERSGRQTPAGDGPLLLRGVVAGILVAAVVIFGSFGGKEFIYFQF